MVVVAQLVRALDCGSRGRRFEPGLPPETKSFSFLRSFFYVTALIYLPGEKFILSAVEGNPVFHPKKNPPFLGRIFSFQVEGFRLRVLSTFSTIQPAPLLFCFKQSCFKPSCLVWFYYYYYLSIEILLSRLATSQAV